MPWLYYAAKPIVRTLLLLLTRRQVKGRENIPSQGPFLIVANHVNLIDVPLVSISFNRRLIFLTKKELFHFRWIGYLVGSLGGFPIYREQLDRKALRQANQVLADGQALFIFPEGTRSRGGQLQHAFPGSALIAFRSGAPILPVAITGTEKLRTDRLRGATWLLRRPRIRLTIGRPFHLPPVNGRLTKAKLTELTNFIMGHIVELLPVEYRGIYAEQGKSDDIKD